MMQACQAYRINAEPQRQSYDDLLHFCADKGAFGSVMDLFPTSKAGKAARATFLESAGPDITEITAVERWPLNEPQSGSKGRSVAMWKFKLSDTMIQLLARSPRGLYGWQSPKLPEDLAIYRSDGSVLLGTVAHEYIGWMNLTDAETADARLGSIALQMEHH